jgi:hypothetical protein
MEKQCFTIVFETDHEPANGKFRNVILQDSANNILYIYDSCGAYTTATSSFIEGNAQMLHWNPTTRQLTISDGNTVNIPSDNTDNQTLEYNQDTNELSIERGNTVTLQTVNPELLPFGGSYIVDGGLFTPGVGLQGNLSNVVFNNKGKRYTINGIPTQVFQPTADTYLYIDLDTNSIQRQTVGHNDAPPVFGDNQLLLAWVRSQAASITNHEDMRLKRRRGYSAFFNISNTFTVRHQQYTRIPFNTVGTNGHRFGAPYRGVAGQPGVHRIPKEGLYDLNVKLEMGSWSGIYRCALAIFVNGENVGYMNHTSQAGNRGAAGGSQGQHTIQRIAGTDKLYLQEGDLVEARVWHSVGSTRTFGQSGWFKFNLIGS